MIPTPVLLPDPADDLSGVLGRVPPPSPGARGLGQIVGDARKQLANGLASNNRTGRLSYQPSLPGSPFIGPTIRLVTQPP